MLIGNSFILNTMKPDEQVKERSTREGFKGAHGEGAS